MLKVPYASSVSCLMYAMVLTRPNLSYAVSMVSRFMANPGKEHLRAVKWMLRYLRGTTSYGLLYGGGLTTTWLKDMLTLIIQGIWTIEDLLLVFYSLSITAQSVRKHHCKVQYLYQR